MASLTKVTEARRKRRDDKKITNRQKKIRAKIRKATSKEKK